MSFEIRELKEDKTYAFLWLTLSVGSLILAGLLSLLLVIARIPVFSPFITDPLFFKRCLVVHVNLALSVWVYSFIASIFFVFLKSSRDLKLWKLASFFISLLGVCLMVFSAGVPNAYPILSNYIPVIDHPVYLVGLGLFFMGIFFTFIDKRVIPSKEEESNLSQLAIRISVVFFIIAIEIMVVSILNTSKDIATDHYYEVLVWGGGHLLQFSSEVAKIAVWFFLISSITTKHFAQGKWIRYFLLLFLFPAIVSLPYVFSQPTTSNDYRNFFTTLMRYGIFPFTLAIITIFLFSIWKNKNFNKYSFFDLRVNGLLSSIFLTILGFTFGALIEGPNTMVPAHYHASIGAVTVSFMAFTFIIFESWEFDEEIKTSRLISVQPFIFGIGQAVFAAGFAIAGLNGMGRKLYGNEQQVKTLSDHIGMSLMGIGGFVAILGGLIFLFYSGKSILLIFKSYNEKKRQKGISNLKFFDKYLVSK
ncbi:MAG: cbb3-type cytochrome c oxidase subunit I [Leptospiraceae bacterium]|nr:cbb3-type cytochrome c oxidase subunit I [Leptospiraceae bacterium]MCK6381708.1 cbb3-type cytochrome c oxidase subunit I [Leptospiraceae bacterium]